MAGRRKAFSFGGLFHYLASGQRLATLARRLCFSKRRVCEPRPRWTPPLVGTKGPAAFDHRPGGISGVGDDLAGRALVGLSNFVHGDVG